MEIDTQFDIKIALDHWVKVNCAREKLTTSDIAEIREHMHFTIEELMAEKGLSEKEAFAVAEVRFGGEADWGEEMQLMNRDNFELRKVVSILSGFFIYFLFQNLIYSSAGLLITILSTYTDNSVAENVQIMQYYIYGCYIATLFAFIAIILYKKKVIRYLSDFRISYLYSVLFVLFLLAVFIARRVVRFEVGDLIYKTDPDSYQLFRDTLSNILYTYPIIFSAGFLFVWFYYNLQQNNKDH